MKKVAIIGGGFGALNVAWQLSNITGPDKLQIDVFEQDQQLAGTAGGFQEKNWAWTLEKHYHHLFAKDRAFQNFLKSLGLEEKLFFKKTKTSTRWQGKNFQLDSALSLLAFQELSFFDRLRTGVVLAFLKILPNGQFLEKYPASVFLQKTMGQKPWQIIWQPLFKSKFSTWAADINMAWFWARIKPRTVKLAYVEGGFQSLASEIQKKLSKKGVKFHLQERVEKIYLPNQAKNKQAYFKLKIKSLKNQSKSTQEKKYDLVISTLPSTQFQKIAALSELKDDHLRGLSAMTMVLRLKEPLLPDKIYWLNINEKRWPFLAVVEHDHFIDNQYYNHEHLIYLGRYLSSDEPAYRQSAKTVWQSYLPYLRKLNPNVEQLLIEYRLYKEDFAQPLVKVNHSQHLPKMRTSCPKLYWVSTQHIYPFDRGLNQAIVASNQLVAEIKQDLGL